MSTKRKAGPAKSTPSTKRAKVAETTTKSTINFHGAGDIRRALQSQSQDELRESLVALRNQFSLKPDEVVAPQDARLVLVKAWLDAQTGAEDVFNVWETSIRQHWNTTQHLSVSLLATLLNLLSTHFIYHSPGYAILKTLLSPTWVRRLNTGVGAGQNDLVLATMKLWSAMSEFGGGRERATIVKSFNWSFKALPRLLAMRRKSKTTTHVPHPLHQPDIRTLYMLFILSFLYPSTPSPLKSAFLEEHRDAFWSIFRGLKDDPNEVVRKVLETCWEGIWCDVKVKRTVKVACFTETTLGQIAKLYDSPEDGPADVAHHFLLALCTRPGTGVCFRDRGWYPREKEPDADEADEGGKKQGKVYNKVLAGLVKTLKVNEDARQQELALRILGACPELVQSYWPAASLTLEPRVASKWIINMAFLSSVVSLPVPSASFLLSGSTNYNPAPPALSAILESTLPTSSLGTGLTKALKSPSGLVQHTAALALARCLDKLHGVLSSLAAVARALEEGPDGQWTLRAADVVRAARARVPDFQVVVAFVLQHINAAELLSEAGLRVMWLYHLALPGVVGEARFDVGKLLSVFTPSEGQDKLLPVRQLHVLRILPLSDQFTWSAKLGSTGKTYLHALLTLYLSSPASQPASRTLLTSLLGGSALFSHDPSEFTLWLSALPCSQRAAGAKGIGPDGQEIDLEDESAAVLTFLDDCILRCLRTPYRYLEDLSALTADGASPLLATVLEQLGAKDFGPSDALALFAFFRKLAFALVGKTTIQCAHSVSAKMRERLAKVDERVRAACAREVGLLDAALGILEGSGARDRMDEDDHPTVQNFFDSVDLQPDPSDPARARITAYELVDWYRLVDMSLSASELRRLHGTVSRFAEDVVEELLAYFPPTSNGLVLELGPPDGVPFEWAFVHATSTQLRDSATRQQLARLISVSMQDVLPTLQAARVIVHRLSASRTKTSMALSCISLLASIARRAKDRLSPSAASALLPLKQLIFVESPSIATLARAGHPEQIAELVQTLLDPNDEDDKQFSAELCLHWVTEAASGSTEGSTPWIEFMETAQLVKMLESCLKSSAGLTPVMDQVLGALQSRHLDNAALDAMNALLQDLLHLANDVASEQLHAVILKLVARDLPLGYDGVHTAHAPTAADAEHAWAQRLRSPTRPSHSASALSNVTLSKQTSKIVAAIVYRYPGLRAGIVAQLSAQEPNEESLPVLHAVLDVAAAKAGLDVESLSAWSKKLVSLVFKRSTPTEAKDLAARCLVIMAELWTDKRGALCARVAEQLSKHAGLLTDPPTLALCERLVTRWPKNFEELASTAVNHALQALVRHYVEVKEDASVDATTTFALTTLAKHAEDIKPQFVDPFMVAAVQYRVGVQSTMEFATQLVERAALKPVNTNRYLQSVIQHTHICAIAGPSESVHHGTRLAVIALLHALFHKHPNNACQPTHMGPLLRLYGGSPGRADRVLLSIFKLYEEQRSASAGSFLVRWTASQGGAPSARAAHALASMDAVRIFRSCAPLSTQKLFDFDAWHEGEGMAALYDPVFVVLLLGQAVLEAASYSALEWVELFRTNSASVALCMLSYREDALRRMAHSVIGNLWTALQSADFQERDQTVHVLDLLRDLLPPPSSSDADSYPTRIPLYTGLLLAHALRGIFHPSAPIYPIASRFLLQRPVLDERDVPLLYGMLYSANDEWRREQGWMVRFLAEGCAGELEWRVLRRRHTWDLVATLFGSASETIVRLGVLQILANLTSCKAAAASLVLKGQLLAWIELHVHDDLREGEDVAFVKILENVVCAVDADKAEHATGGGWRGAIGRCVGAILQQTGKFAVLHIAARVLLRLALLPLGPLTVITRLLDDATTALKRLEPSSSTSTETARMSMHGPPHRSTNLLMLSDAPAALYPETVELLWRACMACDARPAAWDVLTPRLLVLPESDVGQWARRMIVASCE